MKIHKVIQKRLEAGKSLEEIRHELLELGYSDEYVRKALSKYRVRASESQIRLLDTMLERLPVSQEEKELLRTFGRIGLKEYRMVFAFVRAYNSFRKRANPLLKRIDRTITITLEP